MNIFKKNNEKKTTHNLHLVHLLVEHLQLRLKVAILLLELGLSRGGEEIEENQEEHNSNADTPDEIPSGATSSNESKNRPSPATKEH